MIIHGIERTVDAACLQNGLSEIQKLAVDNKPVGRRFMGRPWNSWLQLVGVITQLHEVTTTTVNYRISDLMIKVLNVVYEAILRDIYASVYYVFVCMKISDFIPRIGAYL